METPTIEPEVSPVAELIPGQRQWDEVVNFERLRIAKAKGLFPDSKPTPEQLRAAVRLPGDGPVPVPVDAFDVAPLPTPHYVRYALNHRGGIAFPKGTGRRRPHPSKRVQHIKSAALEIFRSLFSEHGAKLEAEAKKTGQPFNGIPTTDLPKLGQEAHRLAEQAVGNNLHGSLRRIRKMKSLSRMINAGILPGNTNVCRYIGGTQ